MPGQTPAASFRRHARWTLRKCEKREIMIINDQTDGTVEVQNLEAKVAKEAVTQHTEALGCKSSDPPKITKRKK